MVVLTIPGDETRILVCNRKEILIPESIALLQDLDHLVKVDDGVHRSRSQWSVLLELRVLSDQACAELFEVRYLELSLVVLVLRRRLVVEVDVLKKVLINIFRRHRLREEDVKIEAALPLAILLAGDKLIQTQLDVGEKVDLL